MEKIEKMDKLKLYLEGINLFYYEIGYDNIMNEYLILEELCDNSLFYSKTRFDEVSNFDLNIKNKNKTFDYFSEKIKYLETYFENLSNLDNHFNKIKMT